MCDKNKILTDSYFVFCIDVTAGMTFWLEQAKKEIIAILENYEKLVLEGYFTGDGPRNFKSRVVKFRFILFDDKTVEQSRVFDLDDNQKPWLGYINSIKIKSHAEVSDALSAIYKATLDVNGAFGDLHYFRRSRTNLAVRGAVLLFANSESVPPQSVKSDDGTSRSLCDLIQTEWIANGPNGKNLTSRNRKILCLRGFDKDIADSLYDKCYDLVENTVMDGYGDCDENMICWNFVNELYWCD